MSPERFPPDDPREWLNRARSSLALAKTRPPEAYLEDLCFEAQQAAEKAIKAMLIKQGVAFPYCAYAARRGCGTANRCSETLKGMVEVQDMTFPILVEPCDGPFAAMLVGAPLIRAVGPSRADALAALQADLAQRLARGELTSLELAPAGVSGLAGKYGEDPTLREICAEAYRQRDVESPV